MSSPCPYAYSLVANALELLATAEKSSRETEERLRKSRKAEYRARVAVEDEEKREERAGWSSVLSLSSERPQPRCSLKVACLSLS